uniref:Uncharacterized protein n=1 Tax=Ditylenchus dipsaci TaxID=166011 RepID=A0A915D8Y4_9BILA
MSVSDDSISSVLKVCENTIEECLQDKLGPSASSSRNDRLKDCIDKLQQICKLIHQQAIFSTNEQVQDLPTNSLSLLLVPAYLAYTIEEINVERERRSHYLRTAKMYYRQFLETLLNYDLISFKLPWLHPKDSGESDVSTTSSVPDNLVDAAQKRQRKINRLNQLKHLVEALAKLRIEQRRNDDEATQRETILILLRLWSVRAFAQLEKIEEELELLEFFEKRKNQTASEGHHDHQKPDENPLGAGMKTFTIVKSQEQKKVFGLGYPSVPTVTVDEWFDQLSARNGFGKGPEPSKLLQSEVMSMIRVQRRMTTMMMSRSGKSK